MEGTVKVVRMQSWGKKQNRAVNAGTPKRDTACEGVQQEAKVIKKRSGGAINMCSDWARGL